VRYPVVFEHPAAARDLSDNHVARVRSVAGRVRRRRDITTLPHEFGRTLRPDFVAARSIVRRCRAGAEDHQRQQPQPVSHSTVLAMLADLSDRPLRREAVKRLAAVVTTAALTG
jgi:hypothetical protein